MWIRSHKSRQRICDILVLTKRPWQLDSIGRSCDQIAFALSSGKMDPSPGVQMLVVVADDSAEAEEADEMMNLVNPQRLEARNRDIAAGSLINVSCFCAF